MKSEAIKFFRKAYYHQMKGNYHKAVEYYEKSIEVEPTSEAHTFLGWTYSFMDRLDQAIEECKKAILVDDSLGNPYNDIGSYLMRLDRHNEAIPWFEKAKLAERYENREFAYHNLGRVYEMIGLWPLAIKEYSDALKINCFYHPSKTALLKLKANYN